MYSYSPLRYPGGKSKLCDCIESYMENCGEAIDTYIEPFAGGAGIAMALLLNRKVKRVIINDLNVGVYSFWKAICESTEDFLRLLHDTDINMETYNRQKLIYSLQMNASPAYSLELGFATFFLNRTNYSGILDSGPIGGYAQKGTYNIGVRFNKIELATKIQNIARFSSKIKIHNKDIIDFNSRVISHCKRAFIYYDPPYYIKGENLYTNFLRHDDHQKIHDSISKVKLPWLLTYDNAKEIYDIYSDYKAYKFCLSYTLNSTSNRQGTELMFSNLPFAIDKISKPLKRKINLLSI